MNILKSTYREQLLDLLLEQEVSGTSPVSVLEKTVAKYRSGSGYDDDSLDVLLDSIEPEIDATTSRQSPSIWREYIGVSLSAASIILGFLLMLLPGVTNQQLPQGIAEAPDSDWEMSDDQLQLLEGGFIVESNSREVRIGDDVVRDIKGRAVLLVHNAPIENGDDVAEMLNPFPEQYFDDNDLVLLSDPDSWVIQGRLALCLLSGSLVINDRRIEVRDDLENASTGEKEKSSTDDGASESRSDHDHKKCQFKPPFSRDGKRWDGAKDGRWDPNSKWGRPGPWGNDGPRKRDDRWKQHDQKSGPDGTKQNTNQ